MQGPSRFNRRPGFPMKNHLLPRLVCLRTLASAMAGAAHSQEATFEYDLNPSMQLRGEAERYRIEDAFDNRGDVNVFSLSQIFRIGRKAATPLVATTSVAHVAYVAAVAAVAAVA